jgi:hypothetical protein
VLSGAELGCPESICGGFRNADERNRESVYTEGPQDQPYHIYKQLTASPLFFFFFLLYIYSLHLNSCI